MSNDLRGTWVIKKKYLEQAQGKHAIKKQQIEVIDSDEHTARIPGGENMDIVELHQYYEKSDPFGSAKLGGAAEFVNKPKPKPAPIKPLQAIQEVQPIDSVGADAAVKQTNLQPIEPEQKSKAAILLDALLLTCQNVSEKKEFTLEIDLPLPMEIIKPILNSSNQVDNVEFIKCMLEKASDDILTSIALGITRQIQDEAKTFTLMQ